MRLADEIRIVMLCLWIAIIVSLCNGCGTPNAICSYDGPGVVRSEILDGEVSTDRGSTVQINFADSACSGNVVGPHTVLTAKHCYQEPTDMGHVRAGTAWFAVTEVLENEYSDMMYLYTQETLPQPYLALTPEIPVCFPEMLAKGYGVDENGDAFVLRETTVYETTHSDVFIHTTVGPCFGDSGSSLIATAPDGSQFTLGVLSLVFDTDCRGNFKLLPRRATRRGSAGYANALTHREWLEENLR